MMLNRREFLILSGTFVAGCAVGADTNSIAKQERAFNVGAIDDYSADGVYSKFRDRGFFIVRKGENLFALSAICTHKNCKLIAETDRTFYCKCHGSTFDPNGKVTHGPAKKDLPKFSTMTNDKGELVVKISNS